MDIGYHCFLRGRCLNYLLKNVDKKQIIFYLVLALFCLFLACLSTNYDFDLFARLIVGERFVEQGILPYHDFLSYTPTHNWYDHEWGSGVVFYLVLKYFKAFGFLMFQAVTMFLISVFILKIQKLQNHAYPSSLLFMCVFLGFFMHLNPVLIRCQLFSFLFFTIFLYILELTRREKNKYLIWLIPIITIVWNNLHGGVVSGLGLIAMYIAGALFEKRPWKKYLIVLVVSCITLIINPYGIEYLKFLFSATTKQRTYVVEWWPFYAFRHIAYYTPSVIYSLLGFAAYAIAIVKKRKIDYTKVFVLTVTLILGAMHVKLLSLAIISTAAFCYNDIVNLFKRIAYVLKKIEKNLYLAIVILSFLIPLSSPMLPRADFEKYPFYEIEFLKINNIKGNIVTPFGMGSYATYKLYPDNLVFMDGRYEEVYDDSIFDTLRDFELVNKNWEDIFTKYPTDILMPRKNSDVYGALLKHPAWTLIFDGKLCGIFVRKNMEKFSYFEPEYGINYYRETMFKHGDFLND